MGKSWFDYNLAKSHGSHTLGMGYQFSSICCLYDRCLWWILHLGLDADDAGGQMTACQNYCKKLQRSSLHM